MVRGRRSKPIALHRNQGTFRADRHSKAAELEDRLRVVRLPPRYCALCRHEFEKGESIAANEAETVGVCLGCVAGAVLAVGRDEIDQIIANADEDGDGE